MPHPCPDDNCCEAPCVEFTRFAEAKVTLDGWLGGDAPYACGCESLDRTIYMYNEFVHPGSAADDGYPKTIDTVGFPLPEYYRTYSGLCQESEKIIEPNFFGARYEVRSIVDEDEVLTVYVVVYLPIPNPLGVHPGREIMWVGEYRNPTFQLINPLLWPDIILTQTNVAPWFDYGIPGSGRNLNAFERGKEPWCASPTSILLEWGQFTTNALYYHQNVFQPPEQLFESIFYDDKLPLYDSDCYTMYPGNESHMYDSHLSTLLVNFEAVQASGVSTSTCDCDLLWRRDRNQRLYLVGPSTRGNPSAYFMTNLELCRGCSDKEFSNPNYLSDVIVEFYRNFFVKDVSGTPTDYEAYTVRAEIYGNIFEQRKERAVVANQEPPFELPITFIHADRVAYGTKCRINTPPTITHPVTKRIACRRETNCNPCFIVGCDHDDALTFGFTSPFSSTSVPATVPYDGCLSLTGTNMSVGLHPDGLNRWTGDGIWDQCQWTLSDTGSGADGGGTYDSFVSAVASIEPRWNGSVYKAWLQLTFLAYTNYNSVLVGQVSVSWGAFVGPELTNWHKATLKFAPADDLLGSHTLDMLGSASFTGGGPYYCKITGMDSADVDIPATISVSLS